MFKKIFVYCLCIFFVLFVLLCIIYIMDIKNNTNMETRWWTCHLGIFLYLCPSYVWILEGVSLYFGPIFVYFCPTPKTSISLYILCTLFRHFCTFMFHYTFHIKNKIYVLSMCICFFLPRFFVIFVYLRMSKSLLSMQIV